LDLLRLEPAGLLVKAELGPVGIAEPMATGRLLAPHAQSCGLSALLGLKVALIVRRCVPQAMPLGDDRLPADAAAPLGHIGILPLLLP